MNLRFHNTLSRNVEDLRPLEAGRIGIYVCGPTVYDAPHLGHARSAVVFDVFRRFFEALGYNVTLVRNITDIDDKIILKAQAAGTDYRTIADRYQNEYDAVMAALNVQAPHAAPRATAYIGTCQELVARMLQRRPCLPQQRVGLFFNPQLYRLRPVIRTTRRRRPHGGR